MNLREGTQNKLRNMSGRIAGVRPRFERVTVGIQVTSITALGNFLFG